MSKIKNNKILDLTDSDVASLSSSPCQWALEIYKTSHANDWSAFQVNMEDDAKQWRTNKIDADEQLLVKRVLGLFAAGESSVGNSVDFIEKKYITDGCVRQALVRKAFEESIHNLTVMTCITAFNLDEDECVLAYKNIKTIQEKERFMDSVLNTINNDPNFDITSVEGRRAFVKVLVTFYIIVEGSWFFTNFVALLALKRQGKLIGLGKQIDYTIRDESNHVALGCKIIQQIRTDYPDVFSDEFNEELVSHIKQGIDLEKKYIDEAVPNSILGVTGDMLFEFCRFQCNSVLKDAGIKFRYPNVTNPFTWLSEANDAPKKTNFFESHETAYQHKSALNADEWDSV